MNKKTKILLISFWLIIIVGFLYWFNITHWTVYTNSEYGFSVSIPKDFKVEFITASNNYDIIGQNNLFPEEGELYLEVNKVEVTNDDIVEPYTKQEKSSYSELRKTEPYTFNNMSGFKTEVLGEGGDNHFEIFEFKKGHYFWTVSSGNFTFKSPEQIKIYNRIKDSFKVL